MPRAIIFFERRKSKSKKKGVMRGVFLGFLFEAWGREATRMGSAIVQTTFNQTIMRGDHNMENLNENLQYADSDSNAFKAMELLNDEKQSVNEINMNTDKDMPFDPIKEKIEEVRVMVTEYNLFVSHTGKELAERAIRLGLVLIELKSLVKMSDEKWEEWAAENLPFIGKRNRQKYMLLARRNDCHQYTHLGIDRLSMLCGVTKNSDTEDPIGAFMSKHGITVEEAADVDLEEFKFQIDVLLNEEKVERRHIQVSPEVVEAATREGKSFDKALLKKLVTIQRDGGDPEAYLNDPSSIRKQKEEAEPPAQGECETPTENEESESTVEEETEPPVGDVAEDFKTLAGKMIAMVEDILKYPEQISKIDPDSIDELIEKLMELQAAAEMHSEKAEAE